METEIITNLNLRRLALLVATALVLLLSFKMLEPFYPVFAWALALGIATWPLYEFIHSKIKHPGISAGVAVLLVTLMIITPLSYVTNQIVNEVAAYTNTQKNPKNGDIVASVERNPQVAKVVRWFDRVVNVDIKEQGAAIVNRIGSTVPAVISGSLWSTVQLLLILFTLYYFYRDRKIVISTVQSLIPLKKSDNDKLCKRIAETVRATIFGSVMIAVIQGALGGVMFWFLGLPAPAFWGFVMSITAVVPYLGAFAVWGPVAIYLALSGEPEKAAILVAWGALAVGLIDNLLYPYLVGTQLRFHTLPVFFFMLGGVSLLGASGLVLGPVTLAVSDALIQIWRQKESTGGVRNGGR